jgi:hypothetical protein
LLHDLGKIVLATNFDDLYGRVHSLARKQPVALWDVEKEMFGANHGEIGACLLGMWNMSSDIVDAAAFHHEPPPGEHTQLTPLAAVHIANVLEHQLRPDDEFRVLPVVSTPFLNQLQLLQRLPVWRATFANQWSSAKPAQPVGAAPVPAVAPASQTGNQLPGPATATWTSTAAPENEASRAASSAHRSRTRGRIYAGAVATALLLTAALFRLEWNPDDSVPVNARTLEPAEPAVAGFPAPSLEPAPPPAPEVAATTDPAPAAPAPSTTTSTSDAASNALPEVVALEPAAATVPPVMAEAAATNAAPDTSASASASAAPVKAEGPTFKLNGIFYGGSNPSAIVNGKTVSVGESVNGATVIRIGQSEVTLDLHGEHQIVRLPVR